MHTQIEIYVHATPDHVFRLARDVTRWPHVLPHYRRVTVTGRRGERTVAQMVAVRAFGPVKVPVTWRAEQWPEATDADDLRLRFRHIRGVTSGMDVTWHIRPQGIGSKVTIEHEFRRRVPLLGESVLPWLVDRLFTRPIAGRTLATFKRLAEWREPGAGRQVA